MENKYKILLNKKIAKDTYKLIFEGKFNKEIAPGQFINIKIEDGYRFLLRRPISICDYHEDKITIIYKILGEGTKVLSLKKENEYLDILLPLGNGYKIMNECNSQLLVGGGVGIPPLYLLAKKLKQSNINFQVVLGFNTYEDIFLIEEFKALGVNVAVSTMDGSFGIKGNVIDVINELNIVYDYYYTCGPEKMLMSLIKTKKLGQLSFEERMGCGFGACMGCSIKTKTSYKRLCKEGPVLESSEVIYHE
ncbi:MAG: Dihydroorotate dehydrogenase B (NAD(+)), electron transfer subunit [Candidatus Izimaplasma bacterium HR2]|nr:MAG: Dihydroorotate dehydrogenase B (NAD(+)), electron transfer subunit [Candidatus Izimaplasma bacterium HR2]